MARKPPTSTIVLIVCAVLVGLAAWIFRDPDNNFQGSKQNKTIVANNTTATTADMQPGQKTNPAIPQTSRAKLGKKDGKPRPNFGGAIPTADQPFEDWLIRFGYDLSAADMISMLRSDMPAARKRRLLDFFVSESDEGYTFLSTQSGAEFLDQVLSDKSTDPAFARRIGSILKWFSRDQNGSMSSQYESRFSSASSENEKIGLIAAVSDSKFLRNVAYDHRQPASVREIAVDNLLQDDKEPATLKGLLSIADTQPAFQNSIVASSARACASRDELQSVIDVLKKEGMATSAIAKVVGEALAANRRSYWANGMDTANDDFLAKVIASYNSGIESGVRPPAFP
jgi:hypothetical protein